MRRTQGLSALAIAALVLTGCSSPLTLEELEESEISRADFEVDAAVVSEFEGLKDDIPFLIAEDGCSAADEVMAQAARGQSEFSAAFEERNDEQNSFSVSQELITFESEEDATELLDAMESLVDSESCEFMYDLTNGDVSLDVNSSFTNLERGESVLIDRADDSFSWDTETTEYWSGDLLFDFSNRREGAVHLLRFGTSVMIFALNSTEQLGGFAELETDLVFRSDLEAGVVEALARLSE